MKVKICATIGALGGAIAASLGGWTTSLATLVAFMIIDYISGVIVAGAVSYTHLKLPTNRLV